MNQIKIWIAYVVIYFLPFLHPLSIAQVNDSLVAIELLNPSFEHTKSDAKYSASTLPKGWEACNFEGESLPDLQPGSFEVTLKPYHGKSYVGMVGRDNGTFESINQILTQKLKAGVCYTMSLHLAKSPKYESFSRTTNEETNFNRPLKLIIWGSENASCKISSNKILAVSPPVNSNNWHKFTFFFITNTDVTRIHFSAYFVIEKYYNGNILLDSVSQIVPVNCADFSVNNEGKPAITTQWDTLKALSNLRFIDNQNALISNTVNNDGNKSRNAAYDALLAYLLTQPNNKLVVRIKKNSKLVKERVAYLYMYAFNNMKIPANLLDFKAYSSKDDFIFWAFENDDLCFKYVETDTK
jgi:hypothetical protein